MYRTAVNRIAGQENGTNNHAFDGTVVTNNTGIVTITPGINTGADIGKADVKDNATHTALGWLFDDSNPWKMCIGSYTLPVLQWQETGTCPAIPDHLIA